MLTPDEKERALKKLAKQRQQSRMDGYYCLHEFPGGAYECDYVSPWSKSAHNVQASIMVVGQDWASEKRLRGKANNNRIKLGYDPDIPTNKTLHKLLEDHLNVEFAETYATNAFPFIKRGGMQGTKIRKQEMRDAVRKFLLEQIRIVEPKIVICLGKLVFNAIRKECGFPEAHNLQEAIEEPFNFGSSRIFAVAHPGAWYLRNRGRNRAEQDWASIARFLNFH